MRRLFLLTVVALFAFVGLANAQELEPLNFKGIPVTGTSEEFGRALESIGFVEDKNEEGVYSGVFLGREVVVGLLGEKDDPITDFGVYMLSVDSWSGLREEFVRCVDIYSEKFGQPLVLETYFDTYVGDDNSLKLQAVLDDNCVYVAGWILPQGQISISISRGYEYSMGRGAVLVSYTVTANKEELKHSYVDEI